MHGDNVTAGGGCGAHCAVRQGSSGSADSATGKFWGSREQPRPVAAVRNSPVTAYMQTYARFALCETCTSERGRPGGDLLELAQSSTASILQRPSLRSM
jgi:hypothetical protein